MTKDEILKELEKIKANYSNLETKYSQAGDANHGDFHKGVCSGWAEAAGFIKSDLASLINKINGLS